jgi:hypothetical protein
MTAATTKQTGPGARSSAGSNRAAVFTSLGPRVSRRLSRTGVVAKRPARRIDDRNASSLTTPASSLAGRPA